MQVGKRELDNATVLTPKGKISIGAGDIALRDAVDDAIRRGARNLVLDFNAVSRMDSSGMGELVAAHAKMQRSGGRLKLVNVPPKLLNAMGATNLISILDVYTNETEALASIE
jgi:anti-anti-sigma factor